MFKKIFNFMMLTLFAYSNSPLLLFAPGKHNSHIVMVLRAGRQDSRADSFLGSPWLVGCFLPRLSAGPGLSWATRRDEARGQGRTLASESRRRRGRTVLKKHPKAICVHTPHVSAQRGCASTIIRAHPSSERHEGVGLRLDLGNPLDLLERLEHCLLRRCTQHAHAAAYRRVG